MFEPSLGQLVLNVWAAMNQFYSTWNELFQFEPFLSSLNQYYPV